MNRQEVGSLPESPSADAQERSRPTPHPWVVIPPEPYDGDDPDLEGSFYYPGGIEGADGNPVCTFGWNGGSGTMFENVANPHLIAAAPALLEALKGLVVLDCPLLGADPFGPSVRDSWLEQKAQGHGYAHLYLAALDAITAAEPPT